LQTIFNGSYKSNSLLDKIKNFKSALAIQPFVILARPNKEVYVNKLEKKIFIDDLKILIDNGLLNLEIPWEDNKNWLYLMSDLRSSFPNIQLGSASISNKKSIDDSLKVGLNFSMMRFWNKDLYIYSIKNNYLLIPGLIENKDFKDALSYNCQIIKIFPVDKKEILLNIKRNNTIFFIGAGGISIKDLNKFKLLGYKGIVIGGKGYNGKKFDPEILKSLKQK
tara:strand:- start:1235 stop:1900 length:666 start_codon:yes stop_codon:yes gene_type:complete